MAKKRLSQYQQDAVACILAAHETIKNSPLLQRVFDEVNAHPITLKNFPPLDLSKIILDCIKTILRVPQSDWEPIARSYYTISLGTLTVEQMAKYLGTAYEHTHEMCKLWKIDKRNYSI